MRAIRVVAVFCALAALRDASAQRATGGAGRQCKVDSSAAWFTKQREWLDDSRHRWSNDTLRASLLHAAGLSENGRSAVQLGFQVQREQPATDTSAITSLKKVAATRGSTWPTRSVVGGAGTRAVWLLAQQDTALARAVLKRMMEAGPEESNAADVAVLEDRMRLIWGKKQLYGSQFQAVNGKVEVLPTEDLPHVDLRREDAGLPPYKVSACLAGLR
jgi:hypothetical protein